MNYMLGWHCLSRTGRMARYRTGPMGNERCRYFGRKVRVGDVLTVAPDTLRMCRSGLHASRRLADAVFYHRSPVVTRVRLCGRIDSDVYKACASERRVLGMLHTDALVRPRLIRAIKRTDGGDECPWLKTALASAREKGMVRFYAWRETFTLIGLFHQVSTKAEIRQLERDVLSEMKRTGQWCGYTKETT